MTAINTAMFSSGNDTREQKFMIQLNRGLGRRVKMRVLPFPRSVPVLLPISRASLHSCHSVNTETERKINSI